jgi:2-polyprenyl-3-methyl-5-hydroxy-6-metoxy-1,4-benzoquinol methylase
LNTRFDYNDIPEGYYQNIIDSGSPMRRAWHLQEFERIISYLPETPNQSILDIGCFAGTLLSLLPEERFKTQLGVDILEKQIEFANRRFGTPYRSFRYIRNIADLASITQTFDCITVTQVIEHLEPEEIRELFRQVKSKLNPRGVLAVSTPNYASFWPVLEFIVNHLSDINYTEQHITKFNYFNVVSKLQRIHPPIYDDFELTTRTTSHFASWMFACISYKFSMSLARSLPHQVWKNPFGSLILLFFRKK